MNASMRLQCACGCVQLEVRGAPIVSVECCCNSCRTAGALIASRPGARSPVSENGCTRFMLYRKDRVHFTRGTELIEELRLTPSAATRRCVARCCNSPIFLEFANGHWLSLYGGLWPEGALPPLEMRTMTADLPHRGSLPNDVPNGKRQPISFFLKLLGAWAAMGFRVPKLAFGAGDTHVRQ